MFGFVWIMRCDSRLCLRGKIRRSFIRILPGDKSKIEVSRYNSTEGRIIYRLRNKDSKD
ncbi:hypothetical protein Leryth_001449 [Lithospermum erythrorhizon]|nr:hypothetical protein Leryth_001449 [Lithospermum erythrorhizon]